jgi:hypothetical protein
MKIVSEPGRKHSNIVKKHPKRTAQKNNFKPQLIQYMTSRLPLLCSSHPMSKLVACVHI